MSSRLGHPEGRGGTSDWVVSSIGRVGSFSGKGEGEVGPVDDRVSNERRSKIPFDKVSDFYGF